MKTLFLGTVYPQERLDEISSNSLKGIDNASNNYQWALIDGLDYYIEDLTIITFPFIRNYPKGYKKIIFKKSKFSHKSGARDICGGFINIIGLYSVSRFFNSYNILIRELSKEITTNVIIYSAHSPFLKTIAKAKKRGFKIKTCLIVPDLPIFLMRTKSNKFYRWLKTIDNKIINNNRKNIDSYVLLSDFATEKFELFDKPYIRIEGIYNGDTVKESVVKEKYKTILYAGKMSQKEGILELLEAFRKIESQDYRLWIRGYGALKDSVLLAAKEDYRIKYFEEMSRIELLKLQKKATVLINPMPRTAMDSRYFFPSKTMDYLASGTPTIMSELDCLPQEYKAHVYFIKDDSADGIKAKLIEVCEKSPVELAKFGEKASQFILKDKNPIVQVKKLINLLNKL